MPVPAGSPPWIMNSGITRWKMVPSYSRSLLFLRETGCVHSRLPSASSTKFFTVLGASFSKRRQTIVPSLVLKMAYVPDSRDIQELLVFDLVLIRDWGHSGRGCGRRR